LSALLESYQHEHTAENPFVSTSVQRVHAILKVYVLSVPLTHMFLSFFSIHATSIQRPPHITVIRHPKGDAAVRERLASLPYLRASAPSWVHQAAVSSRYAIVVQNPCLYDIEKMVFGESGDYLVFKWQPELGTLIHIVPLDPNSGEKVNINSVVKSSRLAIAIDGGIN
jgi:hypothetical protein